MAVTESKNEVREPLGSFAARPDALFTSVQIQRLAELMQKVQEAEAPPEDVLTAAENQELHFLIQAELRASAQRAAAQIGVSLP